MKEALEQPAEALDKAAADSLLPPVEKQHARRSELPRDEHAHGVDSVELARIFFVAFTIGLAWLHPRWLTHWDIVLWLATIAGAYPIFREAVSALLARRMTMELSMTIALGAALSIGESFTALVIVLFVLVAEVLEHLTIDRGRRAIQDLMDFLPRTASVRREGRIEAVPVDALKAGDVIIVKPGARVPVDGEVVAGHSFVDQSMVTGESLPLEKTAGTSVFAGTVNQSGALEVRATGIGQDTTYGRIVEAVERAERTRAPVQKTADRLSGYLVYFALGAAVLTFVATRNARATISVIIVAGACGVAAGTPLAILGAIGRAARLGVVIKGGIHLESLGRVTTIAFDKTGTVTHGAYDRVTVHPASGIHADELLQAAATAEALSEHPLAGAILREAHARNLSAASTEAFAYKPGRGIVCSSLGTEIIVGNLAHMADHGVVPGSADATCNVHVASRGSYLGGLGVSDVTRPEARAATAQLRELGIDLVLLTGDNASVANAIAGELGIGTALAELLPEQKRSEIARLQALGRTVAMVGDGVNDAGALSEALVGIGMGSGTEVAREAADVILIGNDLLKLVETVRIARRCRAVILQNFVGTVLVDGVGILLAALNLLNPLLAAFIHVASELAFILNSTRLLPGPALARVSQIQRS